AALVFVRSSGTWTSQAELTPNNATGVSRFGRGASLSADGNLAAIGGPNDNANVRATRIFGPTGLLWAQAQKLVGTDSTGAPWQGLGLALAADRGTLAVGGPFNGTNDGAVWFFGGGPDPTVVKSHTGNFNQGETQATYTLTVSNVGAQPTI